MRSNEVKSRQGAVVQASEDDPKRTFGRNLQIQQGPSLPSTTTGTVFATSNRPIGTDFKILILLHTTERDCYDVLLNIQPSTTAAGCPSPQLRPRTVNSIHAMEGSFSIHRLILANRRRSVREYGTSIPKRRSIVPVESRHGNTGGRSCGLQRERKGYSDCA